MNEKPNSLIQSPIGVSVRTADEDAYLDVQQRRTRGTLR